MNKVLAFCILLVMVWLPLKAQVEIQPDSSSQRISQAFELSKNGQFTQAALIYTSIIHQEGPSADLYYNLGTIYLNAQRIAEARIALEKALLLEPRNKLIQRQLDVLKTKIDPKIDSLPAFLLYQWFIRLRNMTNSSGWGWSLLILSYLTLAWFMMRRAGNLLNLPSWIGYSMVTAIGLTCILYFSSQRFQQQNFYILMEDQPLRIAPDSLSQVLLPLGKGIKAEVNDSLGVWYKVILENNDQGWLPKSSLKKSLN